MPEKPLKESSPSQAEADAPWPLWTAENQRDAEAFAKAFVALMLFARTQGIMLGFIGPGVAVVSMEPSKKKN